MKKKFIIIGIIALVIIAGAVGGFFIYKALNKDEEKQESKYKTGEAWGDVYYHQLTSQEASLNMFASDDISNIQIQFINYQSNEDEEQYPCMKVTFEKNGHKGYVLEKITKAQNSDGLIWDIVDDTNVDIEIDENNIGKHVIKNLDNDMDLMILYNRELKEYRLYQVDSHPSSKPSSTYYLDYEYVCDNAANISRSAWVYEFTSDDDLKTNQTDEDGNPIISKFEETFIIPETNEKIYSIEDIKNLDADTLKDFIKEAVSAYKENTDFVSEETKNKLETQQEDIEEREERAKEAAEAKAKKEAEEKAAAEAEAAKKAAEEAAKGLKVGNYTLKYGTYSAKDYSGGTDMYSSGSSGTAKYTIKSDGT